MCSLLFETSKSKSSHVSTYCENQNGTSAGIGVVVNFFIIFYFNRKWVLQGNKKQNWYFCHKLQFFSNFPICMYHCEKHHFPRWSNNTQPHPPPVAQRCVNLQHSWRYLWIQRLYWWLQAPVPCQSLSSSTGKTWESSPPSAGTSICFYYQHWCHSVGYRWVWLLI